MHSHDRTMLASFGFNDPDRGNPNHDLACRYMILPENHKRVFRFWWPDAEITPTESQLEAHIKKGEGQYKTTIGWADVKLTASAKVPESGMRFPAECPHCHHKITTSTYESTTRCWGCQPQVERVPVTEMITSHMTVGVEVKATHIPIGQILRQISLYREYTPGYGWLLATIHPVGCGDLEMLSKADIAHVHLGEKFAAWAVAQQQRNAEPAKMVEL